MQVDAVAFLLDQHARLLNIAADEAGVASPYGQLERDEFFRLGHRKHLLQRRQPKRLRLLLFVAAPLPIRRKLLCRSVFFRVRRAAVSPFLNV